MINYDGLIPNCYYEVIYETPFEKVYLVKAVTNSRVESYFVNGEESSSSGTLISAKSIRLITEEYALSGGKLAEVPFTNKSAALLLDKEYK